eukprot:CAMPEP_0204610246 /NCGR_PEP_ID=MMETSP0661-20131031/61389_1 /ASSEMBLY_ACC=CAM_ASM_000606 /TAXON_ID=109239 /ORGANISM="Alexandrium margalefi, Strain AMGDE01CS-322" /LENGTH=95 /DNA_ID=CAMNT_0051622051 /DNA_START=572 /DNA_END=859 /DNA_ORIENTATION=-
MPFAGVVAARDSNGPRECAQQPRNGGSTSPLSTLLRRAARVLSSSLHVTLDIKKRAHQRQCLTRKASDVCADPVAVLLVFHARGQDASVIGRVQE